MNALCHCKNCSRARGVSPVHILGVSPVDALKIVEGEEHIVTSGKAVTRCFCSKCGTLIHQGPVTAPFRALMPATFQIDGKLPVEMLPTAHVNYESRHWDVNDALPKYKEFPGGPMMDSAGNVL
ncbi:hypothetical protein FOA52_007111 [Chlamydomonas sp. UWO 241]|nr:hypothetical protein FOA52_007111 [Chlamydomonas sp. UWO 241]